MMDGVTELEEILCANGEVEGEEECNQLAAYIIEIPGCKVCGGLGCGVFPKRVPLCTEHFRTFPVPIIDGLKMGPLR